MVFRDNDLGKASRFTQVHLQFIDDGRVRRAREERHGSGCLPRNLARDYRLVSLP